MLVREALFNLGNFDTGTQVNKSSFSDLSLIKKMWSFASNVMGSMGLKKSPKDLTQASSQSDDEVSNVSRDEEGLECPICCESFNIVENVPYVLWCGHTLCQNCVFGLQSAVLKLSSQDIRIPFLVTCPWCQLLSFRIVYKGNLKFPRKNFFLLWMVESMNGDRTRHGSLVSDSHLSSRCSMPLGHHCSNGNLSVRPILSNQSAELMPHHDDHSNQPNRQHFSFHKSLDFFISFTSKFPLVIIFLLIVFSAIPGCLIILSLYFLLTILLAIPSALVLYFAYPILERLANEITSGE